MTFLIQKPQSQMIAMAEIANQLDNKYSDSLEREAGPHNLTYLRRMNGDSSLESGAMT
jgi:hypothetical protein